MKNNRNTTRHGFTLLELIVSTAMLAALSSSCMVIVRTSYTAWGRHEKDHSQRQASLAVLKHIVRQTRQAKSVMAISSASDISGSLSLLGTNGDILVWEHDAGSKEVLFGVGTATHVLATGIEELNFIGYRANGTTQTIDVGLIHSVRCSTQVNIARPSSTDSIKTSCQAWLRAW